MRNPTIKGSGLAPWFFSGFPGVKSWALFLLVACLVAVAGCIDIDIYPYPEEDDMAPSFPCIAADNLASSATLTASTEETGYPKENAVDPRPAERWQPTGSAPAYLQFDLGAPIDEDWADLTGWTETDPNGTLGVASNELVYNSAANADDSAYVNQAEIEVNEAFLIRVPYEIVTWATADSQSAYVLINFDGASEYRVRVVLSPAEELGAYHITFEYKYGATGDWTAVLDEDVGDALDPGLTGTWEISRATGGVVSFRYYDDKAAIWTAYYNYDGDSHFETDTLSLIEFGASVAGRTADAAEVQFGEVLSANDHEIEFFAVTGHNLATQNATVSLTASVDGTTWTDIVAAFEPDNDRTFGQTVTSGSYRYYRFNMTAFDAPPSIGVVFLGPYCQFPARVEGNLDPDHRAFTRESNRSASVGAFLGSAITGIDRKISLAIGPMSLAWAAANLPGLFDLLTLYPAFVAWNLDDYPEAVYYLEIDQNELTAPMGPNSRRCTLNFRGPWEAETDGVVV